ncbi:MAG: neutral/alkaline non-lysosomal ceramidase N-terminal domain-containing protein, partial [Candidatus Hydrogenedentes bacterium]|nr:neutral/alkaline non-lysosomal ceramidase N-terminal domain-containing protein [Candidatus Hydrogenedentota bacterium]
MRITRLTIFSLTLFGATLFSLAQETSVVQSRASLRAGAGKVSIVPPFPTRMGGYFDRTETFTGVKSPVFARALVCATEDDAVAVVTTDLLWMPRNLADAVRETAASRTTLKPEHSLLSAAHNHSAPAGFSEQSLFGGPHNPELFAFMRDALTDAIVEAYAELRPAQLSYGAGLLEYFSRNRQQNNDTVVDPEVGVLKITEADSRIVIATLFNFTGHPVVLGSGNLLICGEYPGAAEQFV